MADFLHGIETFELIKGPRPVRVVRTAVIAIVGCAPKGPRQELVQVVSPADASQFGSEVPNFNIPEALRIIRNVYGVAPILVVNVYDPTTHNVNVSLEARTVGAGGKFKLAHSPMTAPVIATTGGSPTTLVAGTDYTVDDFGNVQILTRTTYPDGTALTATYQRFDPTLVTASHIVGTISGQTRTGFKLVETAYTKFGYKAKILISPRYSTLSAVQVEMRSLANKLRAVYYLDAPIGTTVSTATSSRGPSGTIGWNLSEKRCVLLYPHAKVSDPYTGSTTKKLVPFSALKAGLRAKTDNDLGYWYSDSNKEILGAEGFEFDVTADLTDPTTETNLLNDAGITTYFVSFGTGYRCWGNRSSAYPGITTPDQFEAVRRTADIIYESLEFALMPFLDLPITPALIDEIKESCNAFINTLIGRGALLPGSRCYFDIAKNPETEVAQGRLLFNIDMLPPIMLERLTIEAALDIGLLKNIVPA